MDEFIGKIIGSYYTNAYRIEDVIKYDETFVIYKAIDTKTDKTVELDVFKKIPVINFEFIQEIKLNNAKINYSKIPDKKITGLNKVIDCGFDNNYGVYYMVNQYKWNKSFDLSFFIENNSSLTWEDAIYFIGNIVLILADAKEMFRIIHKDLRPYNILIFEDGSIEIGGFGINYYSDDKKESDILNSDYYRSPETYKTGLINERSNIFSLGVIFYEMLTGERPFKGCDNLKNKINNYDYLKEQILYSTATAPCKINPDIPKGVEEICARMLQKEPQFRYKDLYELYDDLYKIYDNKLTEFNYDKYEKSVWTEANNTVKSIFKKANKGVTEKGSSKSVVQKSNVQSHTASYSGSKKDSKIKSADNVQNKSIKSTIGNEDKTKMEIDNELYSRFQNNNKFNKIECPYCFGKFEHYDVEFRSNEYFNNEKEIEEKMGVSLFELQSNNNEADIRKYNEYKHLLRGEHRKHKEFWSKHGGTSEHNPHKAGDSSPAPWELPIIDKSMVKELKTDADGFVTGCVDKITGNVSNKRVCPHCKNPLPTDFGKYPVKKISIIGVTGSGKTVYISQLIRHWSDSLSKIDRSSHPLSGIMDFANRNKVKKGEELPASTLPTYLTQPIFFDIGKRVGNRINTTTIVIYDVAGENCQDTLKDDDTIVLGSEQMENYAKSVMYSDGLILLLDPKQLGLAESGNEEEPKEPQAVVNTLYQVLPKEKGGALSSIPLAVCISQSDRSSILRDYICKDTEDCAEGFDAKSYNNIQEKLVNLIKNNSVTRSMRKSLETDFKFFNYFSISAIGCDVENNKPVETPDPKRIDEPIFWLFKHFGLIGKNGNTNMPYQKSETFDVEVPKKIGFLKVGTKTEQITKMIKYEEDVL